MLSKFTLVTGGSVAVSTVPAVVPLVGFVIGIVRGQSVRGDRRRGWRSARSRSAE